MTNKWPEGKFEKIKARAIGTYTFNSSGQFGENGPGSQHIGYVMTVDVESGSFSDHDVFYRMFFEEFPGTYYIGFDYTGTYVPFQEALFTIKE